jgi:hypothetical protein
LDILFKPNRGLYRSFVVCNTVAKNNGIQNVGSTNVRGRMILVTANIGDFDEPVIHNAGIDTHYYTERNLPHPLPNLNNRMKGKYVKILTHRFLWAPSYLWVDGSIQVNEPGFVKFMADKLKGYDVVMPLHPERTNVYDELTYMREKIAVGKEYLVARYGKEPLKAEDYYYRKSKMPEDYPLFACRVFARVNTAGVNMVFNEWWMGCLEYSNFDQTMFSFVAWKYKLRVNAFPYSELEEFLTVSKHKVVS